MKKAIAVIQARMSSSRLPGKVMMELNGMPIVWHIYKRAEACKNVSEVIVATSTHESDDILVQFCKKYDLNVFRGSLENVLDRFLQVLRIHSERYVVRITADCPLIHPDFIDAQIAALNLFKADTVWIKNLPKIFEGQGVMSVSMLEYINTKSNNLDDLEHVGSDYMVKNPDEFRIVKFNIPIELQQYNFRLTVDEKKDFELIKLIYRHCQVSTGELVSLFNVLNFLDTNKDVANINSEVEHKKYNTSITKTKDNWNNIDVVGSYTFNVDIKDTY